MLATEYEKAVSGLNLDSSPVLLPWDMERQDLVNRMFLNDECSISEREAYQYVLWRLLAWLGIVAGITAWAVGFSSTSILLQLAIVPPLFMVGVALTEKSPVLKKMSWSREKKIQLKILGVALGIAALTIVEPDFQYVATAVQPWLAVLIVAVSGDGAIRALRKITVFQKGYALSAFLKGVPPSETQKILETLASPALSSVVWRKTTSENPEKRHDR